MKDLTMSDSDLNLLCCLINIIIDRISEFQNFVTKSTW